MRKLVNDPSYRNATARQGQQTIRNGYSPVDVGKIIKKWLKEIGIQV
ncbi:hypothetical protein [Paenibacillus qinlingensis]|nr:hypothetical protein [Paenibacillus qinlingensis]NQX62196.1 hypothetical protein [Paenibacillus qinlingensis]